MTGLGGQDWGGIDPPNPVVHPQFGHVAKFKTAVRGDDRIGGVDTGLGGSIQDWGGIDPPNPAVHPQFGHVVPGSFLWSE